MHLEAKGESLSEVVAVSVAIAPFLLPHVVPVQADLARAWEQRSLVERELELEICELIECHFRKLGLFPGDSTLCDVDAF